MNDEIDNSPLFGALKGKMKIHGDIFSKGGWPTDEEMIKSHDEHASDTEAEAEALEWSEALVGDVGDEEC
ncbi:MAG TPA: hypothetical protein PKE66_06320 [Pyrinomonadaceae bacterium]|nr:hypothetical protein [Pyrinomonadaceae bacterium]